jgi:hypothetical protein
MNRPMHLHNENGSALIVVILVLLVVTVIGILSTRTATIELQVASHDKLHKMTWYATEDVCDGLAPELIEQNIESRGFGSQAPPFNYGPTTDLWIHNSEFYLNEVCAGGDVQMDSLSETRVVAAIFGDTTLSPGNAIQLPEGYHGRGKGLAGGGAQIVYTISGLGNGPAKSQARVVTGWRHLI